MGRYDFRPARVHSTAKNLLLVRTVHEQPWFRAVGENPPPAILARTQPVQHTGYGKIKPGHKSKRLFKPQRICYPEDRMRREFYRDHPWELARPRIVTEGRRLDGDSVGNGNFAEGVLPDGIGLWSENVTRRQLYLIEQEGYNPQQAYDTARREFYHQRLREDIERKVAKEEALHMGAYFRKSTIAWGMEVEDKKHYGFRQWAKKLALIKENNRQSTEMGGLVTEEEAVETESAAAEGEADEVAGGEQLEPVTVPRDPARGGIR